MNNNVKDTPGHLVQTQTFAGRTGTDVFDELRLKLQAIVGEQNLTGEEVVVTVPLSTSEAIGNPEHNDYPLITGREKMMQAVVCGAAGQAFTDMYGEFSAPLAEVLQMPLANNYRRAIFVSTLNAVLRHTGDLKTSRHCRDQGPAKCAPQIVEHIRSRYPDLPPQPRVLLVGLQPRLVENLSRAFALRVTDLDQANIGQEKFGIVIENGATNEQILDWCDLAVVTGTTLVNDTIGPFIGRARAGQPTLFYGVTISGAARLLGLDHICPEAE